MLVPLIHPVLNAEHSTRNCVVFPFSKMIDKYWSSCHAYQLQTVIHGVLDAEHSARYWVVFPFCNFGANSKYTWSENCKCMRVAKVENLWTFAICKQKIGRFFVKYVQRLTVVFQNHCEVCVAIADHSANGDGQLSIQKGQRVEVRCLHWNVNFPLAESIYIETFR